MENTSIAIIGAGPAGLVALKNLREQGFDALIFERRPSVGGLWSYSENPEYTTALDDTTVNVSKFVSSFSDFPMPDHYPDFPSRRQIQVYFEAYINHFDLQRYIRFRVTVHKVLRNSSNSAWDVYSAGPNEESVLPFHKVVFANGCETIPVWPSIQRREEFKGTVMHAQEYRDYKKHGLQGKRVMVVGIGNTGCEIALSLCKHASKTYLAYRRGRILVSRYDDKGVPMDSQIPWPMLCLTYILSYYIPGIMKWLVDKFMTNKMIHDAAKHGPNLENTSKKQRLRVAEHRVREDWRLVPCPSMAHRNPAVQEDIFPAFYNDDIIPVQGFVDFAGAKTVLLADHTTVEVDMVIFATGYRHGFSLMPELEMDGAAGVELKTASKIEQHEVSEDKTQQPALPRLYQMIFPPKHASSVAFISWMAPQANVWCVCELASMAIAQAWVADCTRGREPQNLQPPSLLPSEKVMENEVDSYHTWWRKEWATDHSILHGYVRAYGFYRFLHKTAGTGLDAYLDKYAILNGLRLYKDDSDLWKWLCRGPTTSLSWRLFDTNPEGIPGHGRKVWEGSRDALQKNYEEFERFQKAKAKND
ncbi:uncharacterized protein FIESC28_05699 [Fusarium coffeatum]|uniref:FAD/NAD(P)-binding domain-containing protein n=1 Tax=Fusarium coffeatum TaxID=231269 RepID=A0A366RQ58_9HYPO|nr:uncharacterized protein FIESC28_05699 [Fusarium coffeatum]RBR19234.1 hypothetical protein FIESC28_05699 [Fusarium coffeatum]